MRPISSVSSATSGLRLWKSPIPYLFGGLALMLALISVALVVLICSYRKRASQSSSSSSSGEDHVLKPMPKNTENIESDPKIVVIMAGDDTPSYLAKPIITSSTCCTCSGPGQTPSSSSRNDQRLAN